MCCTVNPKIISFQKETRKKIRQHDYYCVIQDESLDQSIMSKSKKFLLILHAELGSTNLFFLGGQNGDQSSATKQQPKRVLLLFLA
jgi:hypothetical protein